MPDTVNTGTDQPAMEKEQGELLWNQRPAMDSGNDPRDRGKTYVSQETQQAPSVNGVDLSMLDVPNAPATQTPPPVQVDPAQFKAFTEFAEQFKSYTGMDFKQATDTLARLSRKEQEDNLREAWDVNRSEFNRRMSAVKERFAQYPKEMQAKLDNPEGAQLIWAKLQLEQQQSPAVPQKQVPRFDRSSSSGDVPQSRYQFTQSQIEGMSNKEYARNADRIASAYANGQVDMGA